MLLAILSYLSPSWHSVSFSRRKDVQTSVRQCSGVKYTAESRQFQSRSSTTMWPRVSHFTSLDRREASFPVMHKCGPMTVKRPNAIEHIKTPASQTSPEIGWPSPRILPHCCSALPHPKWRLARDSESPGRNGRNDRGCCLYYRPPETGLEWTKDKHQGKGDCLPYMFN